MKSLPLGKSFNLGNGSTAELIDGSRIRIDIVLINVSINWVNLVSRAYVGYCMSCDLINPTAYVKRVR